MRVCCPTTLQKASLSRFRSGGDFYYKTTMTYKNMIQIIQRARSEHSVLDTVPETETRPVVNSGPGIFARSFYSDSYWPYFRNKTTSFRKSARPAQDDTTSRPVISPQERTSWGWKFFHTGVWRRKCKLN